MKPSEFLEQHEWIRGKARNFRGGYCIVGAADECGMFREFNYLWSLSMSKQYQSPVHWNDYVCRSKAEAVAKLKELGL